MSGAPTVPTRDGATIMLVRDGDHLEQPLEVFMVQRHPRTAFGSIHAFPGGVVDAADGLAAVGELCDGCTDVDASARLGIRSGGLAFWVAAARETFEEVGVLMARDSSGSLVRFDDDGREAHFDGRRGEVASRRVSLAELLLDEGLRLALDQVHYVAHWITPEGEPKRYDTRFFLARAPEGQAYAHDDDELIGSEWVRPLDALARGEAGGFPLIYPTIASLQDLARFPTADAAVAAYDVAAPAQLDESRT
jgi:8-oxo-dGTP pyrophosphatase MutT (NUDIX family)